MTTEPCVTSNIDEGSECLRRVTAAQKRAREVTVTGRWTTVQGKRVLEAGGPDMPCFELLVNY